jgi:hypothetical protein
MKRSVIIEHNDLTGVKELELTKAVEIHDCDKEFIHLDKLPDGKWRLVYTTNTIHDFSLVDRLTIMRED